MGKKKKKLREKFSLTDLARFELRVSGLTTIAGNAINKELESCGIDIEDERIPYRNAFFNVQKATPQMAYNIASGKDHESYIVFYNKRDRYNSNWKILLNSDLE